jgi:hypothetical protein
MYSDGGELSDAGVCCIWRVLEAAGAAALNQRCRLLAAAGLPSRLVALCARARADLSAMQDAPRPRLRAGVRYSLTLSGRSPSPPHYFSPTLLLTAHIHLISCSPWSRPGDSMVTAKALRNFSWVCVHDWLGQCNGSTC